MHLLLMGAHPDDETFASGTLAKYVDRGHRATIVHATRGGKGHWDIPSYELRQIRTGEMTKAAKILGAEVMFLEFEDASVPQGDTLREAFVDVYRKLKPDVVLSFHPLVGRDDHRRVGEAASDASLKSSLPLHVTDLPSHRPEPCIYFFGTPISGQEPDTYIDITDYMDVKIKSFRQHASQWQEWGKTPVDQGDFTERLIERYTHRFRELGRKAGVGYAEAFISRSGRKYAHDLFP
ncbi:PIG-L family deacetylase [Candidatus Bathyarchaeota archaeon]|nr:PIG-L family deacetylase [Candidatus Bathyarchaeota archaeon]MBT4320559.1 PIG-L family deacetylase [Candidatus Bathyarchaeota archaeon]MBT4423509.1 PIG-L family deacetylase [Candidatus Bathyarchaeota archaeon]MBT6604790.1 PIG-L family deacetylase [Candidatus Bathyarchaeota archaeon]MBT7188432.1 PIG-L family deacetylase [Candidatus Bathyarchaeota archaeon]